MEYVEYKYESVEKMVNHLIKNSKQNKFIERKFNNISYYAFTMKFINANANYFLGRFKRSMNLCFICNKKAVYNYKMYDFGLYCSKHYLSNMVNINRRLTCKERNCTVYPSYGFEPNKGLFCLNHKKKDMINVLNKRCAFTDCKVRPCFNFKGKKPLYCLKHKELDMVNVKHKLCDFTGCNLRPSFNYVGEKPLFCSNHKKKDMICIFVKKCSFENCHTIPLYNYEGLEPIFCNKHKKEDMKNIKSKRCEVIDCNIRPSFNFKGLRAAFCKNHSTENMVDVRSIKCKTENCDLRASFDFEGLYGAFCKIHSKEGMICVIGKKCKFEGCKKRSSYNFKGEKTPFFCGNHKEKGMINIRNKKCEVENCDLIASFNLEGLRPVFCKKHSKEEMIDVRSKKCLTIFCETSVYSKKYDGYCLRCFVYLFPEKPNVRNYKTKEFAVVEYITNKFSDLKWIHDKQSGSSKRRPDLLCDLEDQIIIIEVDENAHNNEEYCACENKRIMEISKDLNHKPIIFIRFNPDKYNTISYSSSRNNEEDNKESVFKKINGCWTINKNGVCIINDQNAWDARLKVLSDSVDYWKKNKTEKTVEQIFLFYDGFV